MLYLISCHQQLYITHIEQCILTLTLTSINIASKILNPSKSYPVAVYGDANDCFKHLQPSNITRESESPVVENFRFWLQNTWKYKLQLWYKWYKAIGGAFKVNQEMKILQYYNTVALCVNTSEVFHQYVE